MPNDHVQAAATGLPAAHQAADPMLDIIIRWKDALERFKVETDGLGDDASDEVAETTWRPVHDEMVAAAPRTKSYAGALAAIELIARDIADSTEEWHAPFLASALDFLKRTEPKQRGTATADTSRYGAEAFDGPGYYVFNGPEHPALTEGGRVWRVEERLRAPLRPQDVVYEIYRVDGPSDELTLILPPPAFDAAAPRRLGATVSAAVHALLCDTESDLGTAKTLNRALALVRDSRGLGDDKDEDGEVFCYLTSELRNRLEAIDECHNRADKLAFAAHAGG